MNSIGERKYYNEIDILKGIAILTVVLEHSFAVKYVDLTCIGWCYHTVEVIKSFNMQLFFAVSGFLFANSNTSNVAKSYRSKVDRLLVPMIFLSSINILLMFGFPSLINQEEEYSFKHTIISYFIYGEGYWFIYTLFIIFCLLLPFKEKLSLKVSVVIIVFLILIKEFGLIDCSVLQTSQVLYMMIFFLLGFWAYRLYDLLRALFSKGYLLLCLLLVYIILYNSNEMSVVGNWLLPITMSVCVWGVAIKLTSNNYSYPILRYFGRYSLQFYMFNGYALVPARIICIKLLGVRTPFLLVCAVFIICLIILFGLTEISRKIPLVNYLCGFGRKK